MKKLYIITLLLAIFSQTNAGFDAGVARKIILSSGYIMYSVMVPVDSGTFCTFTVLK